MYYMVLKYAFLFSTTFLVTCFVKALGVDLSAQAIIEMCALLISLLHSIVRLYLHILMRKLHVENLKGHATQGSLSRETVFLCCFITRFLNLL